MGNIKIRDVRKLCQNGAMRAFAKGGGIFLEDTATGDCVRLGNRAAQKNAEKISVERVSGGLVMKSTNHADDDQGPYKGFLLIQCEECGEVKAFCAKKEVYGFKCSCGCETALEKLRPVFMHCKCGKTFRYKTNMTQDTYSHTCISCEAPVDLELNKKRTAYVTVGDRR